MVWYSSILITIIALFALLFVIKKNNLFSFSSLFLISYYVVSFFGVPLVFLLDRLFGFSRISEQTVYQISAYSLASLLLACVVYRAPLGKGLSPILPRMSNSEYRVAAFLFIGASVGALLLFTYLNGGFVLLNINSYEDRYTANLGLGLLTRMFPLFILGLSMLVLHRPSYEKWVRYLFIGIGIGGVTYLAMGGYRQILAIHVFIFLVIGYHQKYIKLRSFIVYMVLGVFLLMALAIFRYGMNFTGDQFVFNFLIFTLDTFSPFDSFGRIADYYEQSNDALPGVSVILNEFSSLIPRWIWSGKPDLVLNSGNFFTVEILNYGSAVTISPTLNGSMFLIGGPMLVIFGCALSVLAMRFFDRNFYRPAWRVSNSFLSGTSLKLRASLYYFLVFYVSTISREGLEVFVQRVFVYFVFIYFILILSKLLVFQRTSKNLASPALGKITAF